MKKTKVLILTAIIISLITLNKPLVQAKELKIECQNDSCQPTKKDSFFSLNNLSPGKNYSFKLHFVNNNQDKETVYFNLNPQTNNPQGGIKFIIKDKDLIIYQGYLTKETTLNLGSIDGKQSKDFDFIIQTNSNLNDDWQGKTFNFKSNLEFEVGQANNSSTISLANLTPTPQPEKKKKKKVSSKTKSNHEKANHTYARSNPITNLSLSQVLGVNSNQDILATSTKKIAGLIIKPKKLKEFGFLAFLSLITYFGIRIILKKRNKNN